MAHETPSAPSPSVQQIAAAVARVLGASSSLANGNPSSSLTTGAEPPLAAVYLFGSYARGNPRADSDVDLGLLYVDPPGGRLLDQPFLLELELSEALGRAVECVVMNRAPVDLVHRILRDQQLLLDLQPSVRIRFELAARNRYFDLKPFLDRYRKPRSVA